MPKSYLDLEKLVLTYTDIRSAIKKATIGAVIGIVTVILLLLIWQNDYLQSYYYNTPWWLLTIQIIGCMALIWVFNKIFIFYIVQLISWIKNDIFEIKQKYPISINCHIEKDDDDLQIKKSALKELDHKSTHGLDIFIGKMLLHGTPWNYYYRMTVYGIDSEGIL